MIDYMTTDDREYIAFILTDWSCSMQLAFKGVGSVLRVAGAAIDAVGITFFSKLNHFIFGYFDPVNIFVDDTNK